MDNFRDIWATRHRNWRAILAAAGFLAILAWGSRELLSTPELVGKYKDTAVVLGVDEYRLVLGTTVDGSSSRDSIYRGCVQLSDSSTVELTLVPPIPAVGERIPVTVEQYEDGSLYYSIDVVEWQTEGPR